MKDTKPEKPEDWTPRLSVGDPRSPLGQALRSCQATIIKVADGYTVTVSLRENGRAGALEESTVDTFADAEAIAKAFASQQEFPWEKVEVVFEAVLWANLDPVPRDGHDNKNAVRRDTAADSRTAAAA